MTIQHRRVLRLVSNILGGNWRCFGGIILYALRKTRQAPTEDPHCSCLLRTAMQCRRFDLTSSSSLRACPVDIVVFKCVKEITTKLLYLINEIRAGMSQSVQRLATDWAVPVGARFSSSAQTGCGSHPASCTIGTGSLARW